MKNSRPRNLDYQIKKNQKITTENKDIKTTNINILLNRVKQENKNNSKKKILLSISIIGILSLISIIVLGT